MKTIEQLDFDNIIQIERYLTDQLDQHEKMHFERRLKVDNELRIDFKNVVESYRDYGRVRTLKKRKLNIDDFNFDQVNLSRKQDIAKKLLNYGISCALFATMLVVISALLVAFIL